MAKFGVPYMGSKSKLALDLITTGGVPIEVIKKYIENQGK